MILDDILNMPNSNPFIIELKIINFQNCWKYYKYHNIKYLIIKNIKKLYNDSDPITLNSLFFKNKFIFDINDIFPIFRKNTMYIYELNTLKLLVDENENEIFTKTPFTYNEIMNIKFLTKNIKNDNNTIYTKDEELYFLKISTFEIFYELKTYFTLKIYENINKDNLKNIFNELKMIWGAFKEDNMIGEMELFGKEIDWNCNNNIEIKLLQNINILVNNNLDDSIRKTICYIVIGAFSYVDKNIKKIYPNINYI